MSRVCLYYRKPPPPDRWVAGDRYVRSLVRRVVRGEPRVGGIDRVFLNLCLGLDRLRMPYVVNLPFDELCAEDRVGVLGLGRYALEGYTRDIPIVAGIALMARPSEWPTLCDDYPVSAYLQHSEWTNNIYRPFFGERCRIWPVGLDTESWSPFSSDANRVDFLIYDKLIGERDDRIKGLLHPIEAELQRRGLTFTKIRYGEYTPDSYRAALGCSRGMLFLSETESQGLAYQECLASDIPVLAWDQGFYLDPERAVRGLPGIPASSVPFFDDRCGITFRGSDDFPERLTQFLDRQASPGFRPREYILENLTVEKCSADFIRILDESRHVPASDRNHEMKTQSALAAKK